MEYLVKLIKQYAVNGTHTADERSDFLKRFYERYEDTWILKDGADEDGHPFLVDEVYAWVYRQMEDLIDGSPAAKDFIEGIAYRICYSNPDDDGVAAGMAELLDEIESALADLIYPANNQG